MFPLANQDIRQAAKDYKVRLWEVAQYLQISDQTLSKRLRLELPQSEKQRYVVIMKDVARKNALLARDKRYGTAISDDRKRRG